MPHSSARGKGRLAFPLLVCLFVAPAAQAASSATGRALTLEERVACREKIENVYWAHRSWPKENAGPKPARETVLSRAAIVALVRQSLQYEGALRDVWKEALSPRTIQTEMDRQARNTRDPGMLRELWAALGNDPYLVAECLVRPELAERRIKARYVDDAALHAATRARAERELFGATSIETLQGATGAIEEVEWVLGEPSETAATSPTSHRVAVEADGWERLKGTLTGMLAPQRPSVEPRHRSPRPRQTELASVPLGTLSALREGSDRFYVISLRARADGRARVATVSWRKATFEQWWKSERARARLASPPSSTYVLASSLAPGCTDDTWKPTSSAPDARQGQTTVWTGSEMIVWGGLGAATGLNGLDTGGRYTPATDSWLLTSTGANVPVGRFEHSAVWTGTEMIVWGGYRQDDGYLASGGRYSPASDSWLPTSGGPNAPSARSAHTAIWTGDQMIVWGGGGESGTVNTGGRYSPSTDGWTPTSIGSGVPTARFDHAAIWTGSEMIVWGGDDGAGSLLNTGARYEPGSDHWTSMGTGANVPSARRLHTVVWTGTELIVWGGYAAGGYQNTGGRYSPSTNGWLSTSLGTDVPSARAFHTAVWTGSAMIVWGGRMGADTGGRYDPVTDSWNATSTGANVPSAREQQSAVWTGDEMLVWGGTGDWGDLITGGRYAPGSDSWTPMSIGDGTPSARSRSTAVWTGAEMIVWGGREQLELATINTGARYLPSTDSWMPTSTGPEVPSERYAHTAVWTGSEMIVWGGDDGAFNRLNTGGRYSPTADSWAATTLSGAPSGHAFHTAVWSGQEMILFGGIFAGDPNSGGRYSPTDDQWIAMDAGASAPGIRIGHTAVWTGDAMIVWGGSNGAGSYWSTGSRYSPAADQWTPISAGANVPVGRRDHTAVWTGSDMIVWGGYDGDSLNDGGRYSPASDTWLPTSTGANVPSARDGHTAVWTGHEMIVWGGRETNQLSQSGGRYTPLADSWLPTSTRENVPSRRYLHTAVWSGSDMIVWGALSGNTGGSYCVAGQSFFPVAPCRLLDTRQPGDAPALASGVTSVRPLAGRCGVPAGAKALSVNITAVAPLGTGFLQAFAGDQLPPPTSVLNFGAGRTRANNAIVQMALDGSGTVALRPTVGNGAATEILIDVNGYFQ